MPQPDSSAPLPAGILRRESSMDAASPSSYLGLNNNLSPRSTPKSVSIVNEPEIISPLMLGSQKNVDDLDLDQCRTPRKFPIVSKRLSGRLSRTASPIIKPFPIVSTQTEGDETETVTSGSSHRHLDHLIDQVSGWIKEERSRRADRKHSQRSKRINGDGSRISTEDQKSHSHRHRRGSDASESSLDLERLEEILRTSLSFDRASPRKPSVSIRPRGSLKKLRKPSTASSDTDAPENDSWVPSSDAVLDNSKTVSYTGGGSDDSELSSGDELSRSMSIRDQDAWAKFKFEIVRLVHTLRLKGWRQVPMEYSNEITVQRLSGALTNAVYVVSPPDALPPRIRHQNREGNGIPTGPRKPPPKLLLRIYGPQVEHLIDREAELAILCRLGRKKIGPRLLGTFANGRFEEYFYAKPLTPEEMRNPDTSRQIAKRMRELHDGVDLLDEERIAGPFVFCNWDKWVKRVEQVVSWLDAEVSKLEPGVKPKGDEAWKRRGFICGAPWPQFLAMVKQYRKWLERQYGGATRLREQLVFAHNDTQYGNILRLMPTGESPLLLPANTHKQLVVIDFEYANANLPGLEFANHFTEWCYNYHDARRPYAFHPNRYPTIEEQERFIRAYVRHRPQFNISTPKLTPTSSLPVSSSVTSSTDLPSRRPTSSIGEFMLDARMPVASPLSAASNEDMTGAFDKAAQAAEDQEVARLMHETRLWRLANTAQWVAWGIVQAKVPGMPQFSAAPGLASDASGEEGAREDLGDRAATYRELAEVEEEDALAVEAGANPGPAKDDDEEAEEEFDYLGYAQHRALFFWADAIELGIIKADSLPKELLQKLKRVSR